MRTSFWTVSLVALVCAAPHAAKAQGAGHPPMGGAPPAMTMADALKLAPQTDKALVPLEKAMSMAEAKLKKSPKDAAAKKAYVEATYKYGHAAEYSESLPPRMKYRAALLLYRKALAVDPKHKQSLDEKQKIEDIYKSMPGGVPTK